MTRKLVRGRFLFREVNDRGFDLPLGSVTKDGGVEFRSDLDISVWNPGDDTSGYKRVLPGDYVIGLRSFQSGIGHSSIETIVSPAYTVLRPISDRVHAGYFKHLFKSDVYISRLENVAQGIRQGRTIATEDFYNIDCPVPPLAEQQAIADYLDAETARIDALIAKKQQLIHLLEERREIAFDKALSHFSVGLPSDLDLGAMRTLQLPNGWRIGKISSALRQLTNGYVGPTRDILVDEGVRYIQGLHIKRGTIDFERRPFFVTESWHRARPRTSLRSGDVVIVQTGDIGQCAVIPEDFGEANCHALLIARTNEDVTCGQYLATYLQSRFGRQSLLRLATGALHPHLEFGIRDAPLLLPPRTAQSEIVDLVRAELELLDTTCVKVGHQIGLLAEHRHALVAAAVTGDLFVAEVV